MKIADFFASLSLRPNASSFERGQKMIKGMKGATDAFQDAQGRWRTSSGRFLSTAERQARGLENVGKQAKKSKTAVDGFGASVRRAMVLAGTYLAGRAAGRALITFNSTVEDAKNQIAGMLALTKKTDLSDQLSNADMLFANLQRRAKTLPGTTQDYVKMLSMITQPVSDAKLGLQDLEDITVNSVVAAKAFGIEADVAARDIDQALRGQYRSVDAFTGKILGSMGYKGESGRKKFNAMSQERRAATLKEALLQKQIGQLAEAQSKTFSGVLSTLSDTLQQFFGKIGKPLFEAISAKIREWNEWFNANEESVQAFASAVADGLVAAFEALEVAVQVVIAVIDFFTEHSTLAKAILLAITTVLVGMAVAAAAAWLAAAAPIIALVAGLTVVWLAILDIVNAFRGGKSYIGSFFRWLGSKFTGVLDTIKSVGQRIADFFTETIPDAIRGAFTAALDFVVQKAKDAWHEIRNLPVIKQAIDAGQFLFGAGDGPGLIEQAQAQVRAGGGGAVSIGDTHITVQANGVDPKGVVDMVRQTASDLRDEQLRQTAHALGVVP